MSGVLTGPLGLLLLNETVVATQANLSAVSPFVVQPNILALAPGASARVEVFAPGAPAGAIVTATSNTPTVTAFGTGTAPGPVVFTIQSSRTAIGTALVSFAVAGYTALAPALPVAIVPMSTNSPNGRSSAEAIATVRRRTNLKFGQPPDADILAALNDGLEDVAAKIEPIIAQCALPIALPNTNVLAFPQDVERVRDANFSTGNPALGGTVVYEMVQLDYDEFIQETSSSPAGGIGGIPTIYSIIADQSGVQLIQFYPFANTGYINLHYYKRPIEWYLQTSGLPPSYTDLDTLFQQAVLLFACQQAAENRGDLTLAGYFAKQYDFMFDERNPRNLLYQAKRRVRKRGTNTVRDVNSNDSVVPIWMR